MTPQTLTFPVKPTDLPLFLTALAQDKDSRVTQSSIDGTKIWNVVTHKVYCTATYERGEETRTKPNRD